MWNSLLLWMEHLFALDGTPFSAGCTGTCFLGVFVGLLAVGCWLLAVSQNLTEDGRGVGDEEDKRPGGFLFWYPWLRSYWDMPDGRGHLYTDRRTEPLCLYLLSHTDTSQSP
jgi:hypothetical protein